MKKGGEVYMVNLVKLSRILVAVLFISICCMTGCTKKPTEEQLLKLEEAREAVESAEKKLNELRQERMSLENQLSQKQAVLQEHEAERDDLREKMATHNQE